MKPYTPPFLNAHPEPAASETTETTGNAHPPAPVNALPSQPAEPRRPEQPERTENQAGVPARPDQNATPDSGSQAEPESSSPHDQTALAAHDPRAAEPDFEAVPMTPQMLLHFFQKRSADASETESGVLVPMTFVPPPAPPHHSSKATYRRSFE